MRKKPSVVIEMPTTLTEFAEAVGASIPRTDSRVKACGDAIYVTDIRDLDMLYGKAVRSSYAHALVKKIDSSGALNVPGVVAVYTANDIPGKNLTGARVVRDQPVLAPGLVRFAGEAVAVVAAETEAAAREGAKRVVVEYDPLPVVDDPVEALAPEAPRLHEKGNLCHEFHIVRGDFAAALRKADLVVTRTYRTPFVDHATLEPDGAMAERDGDGVLVWTSSKGVHIDRGEVARVLGLPVDRVRVVATAIGGSFGSKPDLPTVCMAALLTWKTGRPAKVLLTREECFFAKTKRHPYTMTYTHAVRHDGTILGVKVEAIADAGAYASFTHTVITKGLIHAAGPYRTPNAEMSIRAAFTNHPITGAMRGYGVPQFAFALERQMDLIARQLNLDPLEFRRRNILRPGDETVTGQKMSHLRLADLLEEGQRRVEGLDAMDRDQGRLKESPRFRRAWGVAATHMGLGRTGLSDSAEVTLRLEETGYFHLFIGCPDTGQGSDTSMCQIAAQELGVPFYLVRVTSADTLLTRDAGTSTATRVTYIAGSAVQQAASKLRTLLLSAVKEKEGIERNALLPDLGWLANLAAFCRDRERELEALGNFAAPSAALDDQGQGDAYGAYTFGVQFSRVRVDSWTWKVDVERIVTCFDVGRAINPLLLAGQVEGGVAMALGYGLMEELLLQDGVVINPNFDRYLLPTAADVPPITQVILESEDPEGPFGAKGIGEPSAIPGAASIANAVSAAMDVEIGEIPITPERLSALVVARNRRD